MLKILAGLLFGFGYAHIENFGPFPAPRKQDEKSEKEKENKMKQNEMYSTDGEHTQVLNEGALVICEKCRKAGKNLDELQKEKCEPYPNHGGHPFGL